MTVTRLEITRRQDYNQGKPFGDAGVYEQIDGIVHYAVDPSHERNANIVDLEHCARDEQGRVHFSGDIILLLPKDLSRSSRKLFVEVPNRGRKLIPRYIHQSSVPFGSTPDIPAGDGLLFRNGYIVVSVGWQWDVYRSDVLMGLEAPKAQGVTGTTIVRFAPDQKTRSKLLADRVHRPLPAADLHDTTAELTVRDSELGEVHVIPREDWQFAREENGVPVPDPDFMYYESGFEPGKVYEITYRTENPPVAGAGLLALRDIASFLRYSDADDNPAAGNIDHAYCFGISQTGRILRHYVYEGLNLDEEHRLVYDGLIPHVAGARRGEFNHRFAQPSAQNVPNFGHLFPLSDEPHEDPLTGKVSGLLDRQREIGGMPKIFWTNSSAEYWRGDCAYLHVDLDGATEIAQAPEVRAYSFVGTQHDPGSLPLTDLNPNTGNRGRFAFNALDYTPLLRAAVINLDRWAADGIEPPEGYFPRVADGTISTEEAVIESFPEVPGLYRPDTKYLRRFPLVDLGPDVDNGIGTYPAKILKEFPAFVWAIDDDGNEVGDVRMPDLDHPVATYTAWNPRHPETGHPEQIIPMKGSTFFFSRTAEERSQHRDPRPSIDERYSSREEYLAKIRASAEKLAEAGYILSEDIDVCVENAADRYDEALRTGPLPTDVGYVEQEG